MTTATERDIRRFLREHSDVSVSEFRRTREAVIERFADRPGGGSKVGGSFTHAAGDQTLDDPRFTIRWANQQALLELSNPSSRVAEATAPNIWQRFRRFQFGRSVSQAAQDRGLTRGEIPESSPIIDETSTETTTTSPTSDGGGDGSDVVDRARTGAVAGVLAVVAIVAYLLTGGT